MAKNILIGIGGLAKKANKIYVGINGTSKKVQQGYIGINGLAKSFMGDVYCPMIDEVVLDIVKNQSYIEPRKYTTGRYKVEIQSAAATAAFAQEIIVGEDFQIQAYCPAFWDGVLTGAPEEEFQAPSIFGGCGGNDSRVSYVDSTGDAGGNYIVSRPAGNAIGYNGACCHILPIDGVFGIDYLFAFHCGAAKGGAYGGGAGGRGARYYNSSARIYINSTGGTGETGIGGIGGAGGTGTIDGELGGGTNGNPGTSGSGIGAGTPTTGGVAFYNGDIWIEPTRTSYLGGEARIKITYIGPE
jgi:hypothetical protein